MSYEEEGVNSRLERMVSNGRVEDKVQRCRNTHLSPIHV